MNLVHMRIGEGLVNGKLVNLPGRTVMSQLNYIFASDWISTGLCIPGLELKLNAKAWFKSL